MRFVGDGEQLRDLRHRSAFRFVVDPVAGISVGVQQVVQTASSVAQDRTVGENHVPPHRCPDDCARPGGDPAIVQFGNPVADLVRVRVANPRILGGRCAQLCAAQVDPNLLLESGRAVTESLVDRALGCGEDREHGLLALPLLEQLGDHHPQDAAAAVRRGHRHPGQPGQRYPMSAGNRHRHPEEHRHTDQRRPLGIGHVVHHDDVVIAHFRADVGQRLFVEGVDEREGPGICGRDGRPVGFICATKRQITFAHPFNLPYRPSGKLVGWSDRTLTRQDLCRTSR